MDETHMDEPIQVPPTEPEFGSLPEDWDTVSVEKLKALFNLLMSSRDRDARPSGPAKPAIAVGGPDDFRALAVRCTLLGHMFLRGVEITDEIIEAMALRPISPETKPEELLEELIREFGTPEG